MQHAALRPIGLLLASVLLLAACGRGDAGSDGTSAPTPQNADSATVTSATTTPEAMDADTTANSSDPAIASEVPPTDYLTFAQGAVPISLTTTGQNTDFEEAVRIIDGDNTPFPVVARADSATVTEFVYELPALTTFERFAVPQILEVPSRYQTFTKEVEVFGSTTGPEGDWTLLASATLAIHAGRDEVTELALAATMPVRWVRLRLTGGVNILEEASSLDFSEIIGNGTQEVPALVDYFTGIWDPLGPFIELKQEGATVTGCYDNNAELTGTVTGNIVRARGVDPDDGVVSLFILSVVGDSLLRGVASKNNGPFRLYGGPTAPEGTTTECSEIPPPELGCGSIIHGITFDFDSAVIRPDSEPVLQDLFDGLQTDPSATIVIEGHTSSEGSDAYNQGLSERRAQAVVDDLVRRGLDAGRLTASGKGEAEPIATNTDESGRSLNRRVEVTCS